jgi:hypothetical protein
MIKFFSLSGDREIYILRRQCTFFPLQLGFSILDTALLLFISVSQSQPSNTWQYSTLVYLWWRDGDKRWVWERVGSQEAKTCEGLTERRRREK